MNVDGYVENLSVCFNEIVCLMDYCYDNWLEKEFGKVNVSIFSLKIIDVKDGKELIVFVVFKSFVKVWVWNDMDIGKLIIILIFDKK